VSWWAEKSGDLVVIGHNGQITRHREVPLLAALDQRDRGGVGVHQQGGGPGHQTPVEHAVENRVLVG
jgi:hypothetical protein